MKGTSARLGISGSKTLLLAGVCLLLGCHQAWAGRPPLTRKLVEGAMQKAGEKPVEMLVEDLYPVLVRNGLGGLYRAIKSSILSLYYPEIDKVTDLLMAKLRPYLFGNSTGVQQKSWNRLRNLFRDHLRDWWFVTPYDPTRALFAGVWRSLVILAADDASELLEGTPAFDKMQQLVLDKNSTAIRDWTIDIQKRMGYPYAATKQRASPHTASRTKQKKHTEGLPETDAEASSEASRTLP